MWPLYVICVVLGVMLAGIVSLRFYIRGSPKQASRNRIDGKVVIITGATSGIGKIAAFECARKGGKIVLACRNKAKADDIVAAIRKSAKTEDVYQLPLDLSSLKSIHEFVELFRKQFERCNILINNAAYMGPQETTKDGFDKTFQVNYLGHFLLTNLLIRAFPPSPASSRLLRIINLASSSYTNSRLDFDDLMDRKPGRYDVYGTYGRSKLSMVLFTTELNYIYAGKGVYALSVNPGAVNSNLLRHFPGVFGQILRFAASVLFRSPEVGAQSIIHCACVHNPEEWCGKLVYDCQTKECDEMGKDYRVAERLWNISKIYCDIEDEKMEE